MKEIPPSARVQKVRESNFELLRLLAMFMVLALHANHQSLGEPTAEVTLQNPLLMFNRELIQQFCVIAINVFVLISGWFGIHPRNKSFFKLLFQVMFFSWGLFAVMFALGSRLDVLKTLELLWFGSGYWFIPAYFLLYAVAPVLNAYTEKADRQSFKRFLMGFFLLEFVYGWAFDDFANFDGGYSCISFIGLYLLARYLRLYKPMVCLWSKWKLFGCYLAVCLVGTLIVISSLMSDIPFFAEHIIGKMHIYSSPFVIVPAVFVLLIFNHVQINSRTINWLASSAFAIYLIQEHPMVRIYYDKSCKFIFESYDGLLYLVLITGFLLLMGVGCILLDKIRLILWNVFFAKLIK